jgi:integrase
MRPTSEHKGTVQNSQNRTETGQQNGQQPSRRRGKLPKTHQDYWLGRLRKRTYLAPNGKTEIEIPTWQVRLFLAGKEGWFNLDTANQAAAAIKARDTYVFLKANGWDAALAKFKPASDGAPRLNLTVGDYLNAVKDTSYLRLRTFLNYQNCFRTILAESFGIRGRVKKFIRKSRRGKKLTEITKQTKYDYRSGGLQEWQGRIDSIRLARVTPPRVTEWQQMRVKKAGHSPAAIASAKRTSNTYVRCARSLFSKEIRKRLNGVQLPEPLPFDGVELFDSGSMKYISKVDVHALIASARTELKPKEPEVYKTFLLGLFAGMRRAEIDLAEWRMVDWRTCVIRLEQTEWLQLKTQDSAGEITVDAEVIAELREFMPLSKSPFIISSVVTWGNGKKQRTHTRQPRNDSPRPYYRCEPVFDRLNEWLRSKGVKANKPLHEMRKEIGALIATEHGIYAASQFLRHSDITTTARHYAQHKARISVGLGKLLETEIKPASTQEARA